MCTLYDKWGTTEDVERPRYKKHGGSVFDTLTTIFFLSLNLLLYYDSNKNYQLNKKNKWIFCPPLILFL